MRKILLLAFVVAIMCGCNNANTGKPVVAFMDAFEDNTIARARQGFFDALKKNGYSEDQKNIEVIYRNAQGDIPKLALSIKYFISKR